MYNNNNYAGSSWWDFHYSVLEFGRVLVEAGALDDPMAVCDDGCLRLLREAVAVGPGTRIVD